MPPRIRAAIPPPCLPPSVHTHCSSCLRRAFSSSPSALQPTKLRREMFAWLGGPGENFRYPLPNSTNYLSAYDKRGNLLRQPESSEDPQRPTGPETEATRALDDAAVETKKLPKENREDLRPFPLNHHFVSQPVLSDELRNEIWHRVQVEGKSVRQVSVELQVEMRRVGAVVRLVELERRMKAEGKPMAIPYARAVLSMLPQTPFDPRNPHLVQPHEPINDLPVHPLTHPQVFYPTSESRHFTRTDAGRVFSGAPRLASEHDVAEGGQPPQPMWQDTRPEFTKTLDKHGYESLISVLKPADSRLPHAHLVPLAADQQDPELRANKSQIAARYQARLDADTAERARRQKHRREQEESRTRLLDTDRWQFVVKEVTTDRMGTGLDGRGTGSPGYRYGVPRNDRKKGVRKIPTSMDV